MEEIEYLWEHWKFNADQRLKAFNFFVVLAVFANGGLFASIEKCVHPSITILIAIFIISLSSCFWMVDERSRKLLLLSIPGIKFYEQSKIQSISQLFHLDEPNTKTWVRYTVAFRLLFITQMLLGGLAILYGFAFLLDSTLFPSLSSCKN